MSDLPAIAVIGTGAIGTAVERVLRDAGHPVDPWNRSQGRPVADVVERCDLALVCVTDHDAVHDVLSRLPERERSGGPTAVILSTGSPAEVERTVALAHSRGLSCLAAGVQTAPEDVGTSRALFLYAGDPAVFARHRDVLDVLGGGHWVSADPTGAAVLDLALFGLWYDAQLGLLRAFETAAGAGVAPSELVDMAVTHLGHVAGGVAATAEEVARQDYPRGPATLVEHLRVLERLTEVRRSARLGDGGLAHVARLVEELTASARGDQGLTALLG
jgi:3-hydroxyisobutyrate dehydrogenase-like beta-hydroxyacid dehydrogenase